MEFDVSIGEELWHALVESADAMARSDVEYALIGGIATGLRSQPRFTKDVDFLLHVPQLVLPVLLGDLQARGFAFDLSATIHDWNRHHMVVLFYKGLRVDWLKPMLPIYQHVLDVASDEILGGRPVRVASIEGLVLLKLLAFRNQDLVDIENLIAASVGKIDLGWIRREWQTVAQIDDPRMLQFEKMILSQPPESAD